METKVNGALLSLENDEDKLYEDEEAEDYVLAVQLVHSGVFPWVLKATLELDVFGIIARAGPAGHQLSATEISTHLQLPTSTLKNPDAPMMLDRMLRLLANFSIVSCSVCSTAEGETERRYGLGRLSRFFLPDEYGATFAHPLALLTDPVVEATWTKLKDAVLQGGVPFNMVHGAHAYEYPSLDPRFNDVVNKASSNYPKTSIKMMLRKYKGFEGIKQLVDVGGGLGHHLHFIISKYPSIRGINFDMPHVIRNAPPYHGVEHISGDMFESIPQGDAIFMKWVLIGWSDDKCLDVLKNCHNAIPMNGKVIVMESIVDEGAETSVVAKAISQMDLFMMTKNPGGRERTLKEFEALAKAAGFAGVKVDCQCGQFSVMEFYK